jgi:hypothetical protein
MTKFLWNALFFIAVFSLIVTAQTEHKWKPLIVNDAKKIWVDDNSIASVKGNRFEVWLLQMYIPPISLNGADENVSRIMSLYAVDLSLVKYGIEKVIYYNEDGKELSAFDYQVKDFADSLKYTYPVLENSPVHLVIKDLYKNSSEIK